MKVVICDIDDTLLMDKTKESKWAKKIMGQIPAGIAVALVTSRSDTVYTETKAALDKVIVGAFARLPARDEIPTKKKLLTVPITAAKVACQNEIPNPKKNKP